ncbi:MAG: hypothetical protein J5801_02205 [Bacteroidales bacterium]|nr:hypothetical protein [Bacteroidales bacterium]
MNFISKKTLILIALLAPIFAFAQRPAGKLQAEFYMPIYRNAKNAELTVVVPENGPKSTLVEFFAPDGSKIRTEKYKLKPGENHCAVKKIDKLADGRYTAMIHLGDTTLKRLLRIEHVPDIEAPKEPIAYRKLIFTPDNYMFQKISKNLKIEYSKPEIYEAVPNRDSIVVYVGGNSFYKTADGRFAINVVANPYVERYGLYAKKPYYFTAVADKPEGPYVTVPKEQAPAPEAGGGRMHLFTGGAMMCSDHLDKDTYEIYDPAKHGTYKLTDIRIAQQINPRDFGCVKAEYRTYWAFATTSTGDTVFLSDKPVFQDIPVYKEDQWDTGFTTNDNFGNSWLSADGKTLYIARGQTLRRDAPYDLPYDMVDTRVLTVYSTQDGKDWKYIHSFTSDGERDTPYTQQYGARICKMEDAGLYLVFVEHFVGDMQQSSLDLDYSRDGVNFYDAPGDGPFLYTDNLDEFYFGGLYNFDTDIVQDGKKYYQMVAQVMTWPHFFPEALFARNHLAEVTAEDYERIFKNRGMAEKLPYFDKVGGWEGLAKLTREGHSSIAVISYRADGWFGVKAGKKAGCFTTNPILGGGMLTVNAEIAEDGYIQIELLDNGPKKKVTLKGDDLHIPAFQLPEGPCRLRVKMRNANLYSMYID